MFENTTNFDLDDVSLDTSFTPSINSTQVPEISKKYEEPLEKATSKVKCHENSKTTLNKSVNASLQNEINKDLTFSNSETRLEYSHYKKDTFVSPSRVVKRKFPGPAGLLPEIGASNKSILQFLESEHFENDAKDIPILSQQTNSVFEDGPWKEMSKDFHIQNGESILDRFDIKWIKRQALKQLLHHKAPFLAAIIQNLDILDGKIPTVNVSLKDCSGDIRGTILHSLYEEYSNYIRIGSVIVLKHFGVLSAGYNNHCLTITPNNLVSIYCSEKSKFPNSDEGRVCKKIVIQDCNIDDILKKYNEDVASFCKEDRKKVNLGNLKRSYSNEVGNTSNFNNGFPIRKRQMVQHINRNPSTSGLNTTTVMANKGNFNVAEKRPDDILTKDTLQNGATKFNFKQNNVNNFKTAANHENVDYMGDFKSSEKVNNCDSIVISSSQISVKPDRNEHAEIWKNLLEDVDTDSLFDDF